MILYVNGDSNSAGAEAINPYAFAEDDPLYWALGRKPHPDNLRVSYGCIIANYLNAVLECGAESASSNQRIMRTTNEYLQTEPKPDMIIIGWSTWEREEWFHDGVYYQVTGGGTDTVPNVLKDQYKNWVIKQDYIERERKLLEWHDKIYKFHIDLEQKDIPHVFFNAYSDFSQIRSRRITTHNATEAPPEYDWNGCYVDPYDQNHAYYYWLKNKGFDTVKPTSYHFGADAHQAWADFLYQGLRR
jgi:hypothetical protein